MKTIHKFTVLCAAIGLSIPTAIAQGPGTGRQQKGPRWQQQEQNGGQDQGARRGKQGCGSADCMRGDCGKADCKAKGAGKGKAKEVGRGKGAGKGKGAGRGKGAGKGRGGAQGPGGGNGQGRRGGA